MEKKVEDKRIIKSENPICFRFKNVSDQKRKCSLMEIFGDNEGIDVDILYMDKGGKKNQLMNLRFFLMHNNFHSSLVRLQFNADKKVINNFYFRPFLLEGGIPYSQTYSMPLFIVGNEFHPFQFQSGIIDSERYFNLNGVDTDVTFYLYPQEEVTVTIFNDSKNEPKKLPDTHPSIVLENDTDKERVIDIFSAVTYADMVKNEKDIRLYHAWSGSESFGKQVQFIDEKAKIYDFIYWLSLFKDKKMSQVDITNPKDNDLNPIIINGKSHEINKELKQNQLVHEEEYVIPNKIKYNHILPESEVIESFQVTIPTKTSYMFTFHPISEKSE